MNNQAEAVNQRVPVSEEITSYLDTVAGKAEQVANRVESKLMDVCSISDPSEGEEESTNNARNYPAYFSSLREKINLVEKALSRINEKLDMCEL